MREVHIEDISQSLVDTIASDNNSCYNPPTLRWLELDAAVAAMRVEGCQFNKPEIELCAAGEQGEAEQYFARFPSYPALSRVLNTIFEEDGVDDCYQ